MDDDLSNITLTALDVNKAILSGKAFPKSWLTLHVLHHRKILDMLGGMADVMIEKFLPGPDEADDFPDTMWKSLLDALLQLVRSETLALEILPEQKRRAVWKIVGDIREQGAALLGKLWDALGWDTESEAKDIYGLTRLGGYQVQYVPALVPPITELCLSVHEGLRSVAVEILQSMILSDYELEENIDRVKTAMIESLDDLFREKNVGENAQQKLFIPLLLELFEPVAEREDSRGLWDAIKELVEVIDQQLELLVAVYSPGQNEPSRIMHTLQLMDFLRDHQKEDLYISYVHQLVDVEVRTKNYKEAGLALCFHADLYDWDLRTMVPPLFKPLMPAQTAFERKEKLYFDMINYFEEGVEWYSALACYQELAQQYEHTTFDFAKLARTQRATASIYEKIARGDIEACRYFRVIYRGLGFPTTLRDKQFIYEGTGGERINNFCDKLQQLHPTAKIIKEGKETDQSAVEGQFLYVAAVYPHRDLDHALYQRDRVPHSTKEFILTARPQQFSVTARRHTPEDINKQWVDKTVYTVEGPFPTILRRSEILQSEVISLSPLQTAVERTVRKTSELAVLEKRWRAGDEPSMTLLMEALKSTADASNNTSIARYHALLRKPEPRSPDPEEKKEEPDDLEMALQTALTDFAVQVRMILTRLTRTGALQENSDLARTFQQMFSHELGNLAPPQTSHTWMPDPDFNVVPPTPRYFAEKGPTKPEFESEITIVPAARPRKPSVQGSRNRLSAMLKRGISGAAHDPEIQPAANGDAHANSANNGHLNPHDDAKSTVSSASTHEKRRSRLSWRGSEEARRNDSTSISRSKSNKSTSRSNNSISRQAPPIPADIPRPVTSASIKTNKTSKTTKTHASSKSAGGSIRKRLSNLAMVGKKPSKQQLSSQPSVREE